MKNNTFIKAVSAVLAAGILLVSAGCGKETKGKPEPLNQPVVENDTAIIEYPTINEKGEEEMVTKTDSVLSSIVNKPVTGISLAEKLENKQEKERFEKYIDTYDISEKEYKEIEKEAENWVSFDYDFYVANSTSKRILFRNITHTAKDGIIIDNDMGCEFGLPTGVGMMVSFSGYFDATKYQDEEAMKAALAEMNIKIIYTQVESIDDSIDDWSAVETQTMDIDFTK